MGLLDTFRTIVGGFFSDPFPARGPQPLPGVDAREHALAAYADFVAGLEFVNPTIAPPSSPVFAIPRSQVLTHQPADPELLKMPSVAVVPTRGTHDVYALGPHAEVEGSMDVWAPGTVLLRCGEYRELCTVEVWAPHDVVRTAVLAAIQSSTRRGQASSGLLLRLPDYYGVVARYTLVESEHVDDPDVVRGRVRAHAYVQLEVPEVELVDAITLRPYFRLDLPQ